jgi:hypothetical protein
MATAAESESDDALLNPHRAEEQDTARAAGAARLQGVGIRLTGMESSDDIADLLDAVDRFEQAVESRGGDLMVDEAPAGQVAEPDDPEFLLPARRHGEAVDSYIRRIIETAGRIRHHGRRPG